MKTAFICSAYVTSDLPLTSKVMSVFEFRVILFQEEEPDAMLVKALAEAHTRNGKVIAASVERTSLPDELAE